MIDPGLAYKLINVLVVPAWALLILAPRWSWTDKIVHAVFYPLMFGVIYVTYLSLGVFFGHSNPEAGFSTIEAVGALFSHPVGLLTGWAHYLVFDLFVGAWIARDAKRRDLRHAFVIPCLFFTFMFGPLGLLLYVIIRKLTAKGGWSLEET